MAACIPPGPSRHGSGEGRGGSARPPPQTELPFAVAGFGADPPAANGFEPDPPAPDDFGA